MKTKLILLFAFFTIIGKAQQITIDSNTVIYSQNYSFNSFTNEHTIFTRIDTVLNGYDVFGGYLLIDLGTYQGQNDITINYNFTSNQFTDSALVSLQAYDSLNNQLVSNNFYLSNQNNQITVYFDSLFAIGDKIRIAFNSTYQHSFTKKGIFVLGALSYNIYTSRTSNPNNNTITKSYAVNKNNNPTNSQPLTVSIYPNPTKGNFSIQSESKIDYLKVVDIYGKTVHQTNNLKTTQLINLSNQPKGVYFIHITSGEERVIKKIVKQ